MAAARHSRPNGAASACPPPAPFPPSAARTEDSDPRPPAAVTRFHYCWWNSWRAPPLRTCKRHVSNAGRRAFSHTIRASGSNTPRQQAGHTTVPDLAAMPSKSPCNVGAIHTRHSGSRFAPQIRCHEIARHRPTVYECLPYMHMSLGCVKGRPIAEKVEHRLTVIVSADVVAHRGATHSRRRI